MRPPANEFLQRIYDDPVGTPIEAVRILAGAVEEQDLPFLTQVLEQYDPSRGSPYGVLVPLAVTAPLSHELAGPRQRYAQRARKELERTGQLRDMESALESIMGYP